MAVEVCISFLFKNSVHHAHRLDCAAGHVSSGHTGIFVSCDNHHDPLTTLVVPCSRKAKTETGMTGMFSVDTKLGDVVKTFPGAGAILKGYKVDYCCGGERTVKEALTDAEIGPDQLVTELNSAYATMQEEQKEQVDWEAEPLDKFVSYIINTHHAYLQKTLPILSELTTKILRVHGANHSDVLSPVHRVFHLFKMDLEQHMITEETKVFPLISTYAETGDEAVLAKALANIEALEAEHAEAGDLLKQMRELTSDYSVPEDACGTYAYTFQKLEEVEGDMFTHVHLENNVLFPRLQRIGSVTTA